MPGRKKQTRFDRCLKAVKRKGGAVSPGAVCQKSVGRGNPVKRGKHAKRNPAKRKNPVESATQAYRDFHGKEPAIVIETETPVRYHSVLAGLGKLEFIDVKRDVDGGITTIEFGKGTYLSENEKRTQLFISGGDQSVRLSDFGIKTAHETEVLGEAVRVGYFTEKKHLIAKDGGKALYVHKFGPRRPTVIYDTRNKLLSFAGGGYSIPSEGIDG